MLPTVLIIDDNEEDILLTKLALKKSGREMQIEMVKSGEDGLKLIHQEETPLNLILVDLKMYGMDGIEVLKNIRSNDRTSSIPVVIVTHSDLQSDREIAQAAGANNYLNKTADFGIFKQNLEHILNSVLI